MKKITNLLFLSLETLGSTAVTVSVNGIKTFIEYFFLTLKLIWEKSIKIREKVANISKYLFVFIASPFVKMSINITDMNKDLKTKKNERGVFRAILAFFPYLLRIIFGKRGLAVTTFNYAAPVLSIVFLFNIVTYATSSSFTLKLMVNGEFLGYIENEQVYLEAEAFVLQRVNYIGSELSIEMIPEFSITNGGYSTLTTNEVSNKILRSADFTLVQSYGFFIDGKLYGAILAEDFHIIDRVMESLLDKYRIGDADEEVSFLNNVVWNESNVFLEQSIVHPQKIITMVSATTCTGEDCEGDDCEYCEPFLPISVVRTEEYESPVAFGTEHRNDDSMFETTSKVTQKGEDGINWCVARVAYINGTEIRRNVIESTVIVEPITKIINIGTKQHIKGTISKQGADYGKFIWPVINAEGRAVGGITQGYHGGHRAYDIAGSGLFGTPVVAVDNGVVVLAQYSNGNYGHTVIVQHSNGLRTLYAHNSEIQVSVGQEVSQGEQIANLGTTGKSTGPHLHFEVMDGNSKLDPGNYLQR